jgi:catecholate siderophore receptor
LAGIRSSRASRASKIGNALADGHVATTVLLSISYVALSTALTAHAQPVPQSGASQLPPVQIDAPTQKPRRKQAQSTSRAPRTAARVPRRNAPRVAAQPAPAAAPSAPVDTQDARTGTAGVYANSTSVATKSNTPLVRIPQSVDVLTKSFIKDQGFQTLTDVTRYVPGVAVHQGEGNRDELVIRGVDSSANFFVNGFRDDVQYYRDLYNTQSIEVLKGPSALVFGRGAGGGLVNRTLKEAEWAPIREVTVQTGSYADRRIALDVGQGINENVAARFNAFYEASDTFRDFGHFERYGINPTMTFKPGEDTKVKLSYEFYHDDRLTDRGNPSQALTTAFAPLPTSRFNPTTPFVSDRATLFGSPIYNDAHVSVQTGMASIEHDFGNGLSIKNSTIYASYLRGYRNIYPGNGPLAGAVNPSDTMMNLAAYQNANNRNNAFNQTDFTYKAVTGPVRHTLTFGTEFGIQAGLSRRDTGFFPQNGGANTVVVNPFAPTYFGPVVFNHIASDANSRYRLDVQSGYAQDQIELTRWLEIVAGARYDRFDLSALDQNTNITRGRVDEKVTPRAAVIVKPIEGLSVYGSYSVSYLPASGDQFSTLTDGTLVLEPQKFENKEIGIKYQIFPRLLFTAAAYELNRTNVPIADPSRPGFFFPSGSHKILGFETALKGYITDAWQSALGYAYTDARITSATSPTILSGNVVQLVPLHQFSWWNKYQFTPMWSAAVGVIYFSDSFASSDNTVRLPDWVRFDAAVYARINETWKAQINVENVFDTLYWASADGNNNLSPGQGRTIKVSATANF